jgi:NADP-dependent 3-hydroxy acid dehydrogenase YdfG
MEEGKGPIAKKVAVITGASAGIGAATAFRLSKEGFDLLLGARRSERLERIVDETGAKALPLDVTVAESVAEFAAVPERVDVLVNNAGLALGEETISQFNEDHARTMWETNVQGLLRITQALLPKLEASGSGHIVNIGSVGGYEVYPGAAPYTATKHAVRAISQTLRLELLGKPIRVTEVSPGVVKTEFQSVRHGGETARARGVYEGFQPLAPEDVADCIAWAVTRPVHVNIDSIIVKPTAQAQARIIHRR